MKTINTKLFGIVALACLLSVSGMLVSCTPGAQSPAQKELGETEREVDRAVEGLVRAFESEDSVRFIRAVHDDYDDGQKGRSQLRSELRRVFDLYQRIRLDTFGSRITVVDDGKTAFAKVNWNLTWTCTSTTIEPCDASNNVTQANQVVRRTGRTSLGFKKVEGEWKLIDQSGAFIFGSRVPKEPIEPGQQRHP